MRYELNLQDLPDVPLWRVSDAAAIARISEYKFLTGAARGDIDIEIIRVGRTRYVRSSELIAWLRPAIPAQQPAPDCLDLF